MKRRWVNPYLVLVGLSEFATGLSLIFFPEVWFRLSGMTVEAQALWFMRWIGTWVGAVGLLYLLALKRREERSGLWLATTTLRILVAIFLLGSVILEGFPKIFLGIAFYDLALGLFQSYFKGGPFR
ncbi:MAG: hypothetical protein H6510_13630 [Acidobacteria bacterium]|nr:hypothetical protein [Acidobacteriota bacterium]MCB9398848.1 hypothetical protein [Acidobacteriota bacterium]